MQLLPHIQAAKIEKSSLKNLACLPNFSNQGVKILGHLWYAVFMQRNIIRNLCKLLLINMQFSQKITLQWRNYNNKMLTFFATYGSLI